MLPEVNVSDYLKQVTAYGGLWSELAAFTEAEPTAAQRIKALFDAGLLENNRGELTSSAARPLAG